MRISRTGAQGFTLIEMLVVIAILGITFGLAMFAIGNRLPNWKLQEAANEVVQRMQFARSEAVKMHRSMTLRLNNVNNSTTSEIVVCCKDDGTSLQTVVLPDKHTGAYISSAADGAGVVTQITIDGKGVISGGTMPILVTVASTLSTTPATYVVEISRSGVARVR